MLGVKPHASATHRGMMMWHYYSREQGTAGLGTLAPIYQSRSSAFVSLKSPFITTVLHFLRLLVYATSEGLAYGWILCREVHNHVPVIVMLDGCSGQKSEYLILSILHLAGVGTWLKRSRGTRNGFSGQIPTAFQASLGSMGSET